MIINFYFLKHKKLIIKNDVMLNKIPQICNANILTVFLFVNSLLWNFSIWEYDIKENINNVIFIMINIGYIK